jgi:hypothetical protein
MYSIREVDAMKNLLSDQNTQVQTPTEKKTPSQPQVADEPHSEKTFNGLKIDNTLYCLDTGKEKYLFTTEDEAIAHFRTLNKKEINPDNSQIVQVTTTGNTWKLVQVPWSHIAVKLL